MNSKKFIAIFIICTIGAIINALINNTNAWSYLIGYLFAMIVNLVCNFIDYMDNNN